MNEIKKCSLAGISFTLENDAYKELDSYINSLKQAYLNTPDGEEIIADIEARIAELILSAIPAEGIVTKPLVMNIIKQLGSAEEIDSEQPNYEEPRAKETTDKNGNPRMPRRLYRDLQNNKLGGVCAGIANYFDIDHTWVRLAALTPLVIWFLGFIGLLWFIYLEAFAGQLSGLVILGYIVMWMTVPPASSARQKLEMKGERITASSIRDNVQPSSEQTARTLLTDIVNIIGTILLICLKIMAAIILVALIVGACFLVLAGISAISMLAFDMATGIALICLFFVVAIPVFTLIYLVILLLISQRASGRALLIMFILWILFIAGMTIAALKSPVRFDNSVENLLNSVMENDEEILYKGFSQQEIDEFRRKTSASAISDTEAQREKSSENVTTKITYDILGQRVSCHSNSERLIIFSGEKDDVEHCAKSLNFEQERVCFQTKRGDYSIELDGRAYRKGSRINEVATIKVDEQTVSYHFVADGVKIRYEVGPSADIDKLTKDMLEGIFGATSSIFQVAGGVIKLAEGFANTLTTILPEAADEIQEALGEAHKELHEAQKQMQQEAKDILKQ